MSQDSTKVVSDDFRVRVPPELQPRVRALLDNVEIANIRTVECSAVLKSERIGQPRYTNLSIKPEFFARKGSMANRFEYLVEVEDIDGADLAEISFTIVIDYSVASDYEPDHAAADAVCATTGYFAAYPYARELIQAMAGRLQLDPLVVGFLRAGHAAPRGVTVVSPSAKAYATEASEVGER
jgi:hypothetical protein